MKMVNGWAFPDEDEFMAQQMQADGKYQREHLDAALRYVRGDRLAIDGGAHVGTWTVPMALQFATVHSFEPSPDTYQALAHNASHLTNVVLHHQALGKEPGKITMCLDNFEEAIRIKNTGARFVKEGGEVERITIDSLDLPALDFLKLDVEGGEVDALAGALQTLKRFKPVVLFEDKWHWKRYGYERKAPHALLTALGAKHLERVSMDEIWGWG